MHSSWIQRKINEITKEEVKLNKFNKNSQRTKDLSVKRTELEREKLVQLKKEWAKKYGNDYVSTFEKLEKFEVKIGEGKATANKIHKLVKTLNEIKQSRIKKR